MFPWRRRGEWIPFFSRVAETIIRGPTRRDATIMYSFSLVKFLSTAELRYVASSIELGRRDKDVDKPNHEQDTREEMGICSSSSI